MSFKIPPSDYFRRLAHGVLIFFLWQTACRNTAFAFRSGAFLTRKPPNSAQTCWPSTCSSKCNHLKSNVYVELRRRSATSIQRTSLAMGFRDLLKRRILGKKDKDDNSEDEEPENNDSSPSVSSISGSSQVASAPPTRLDASSGPSPFEINGKVEQGDAEQKAPKPERRVVRMAEDPTTGEVNVQKRFGAETVQEKINRVKAGKMTDEEKQAFLRTALSAGDTPLSRQPLIQKKTSSKDDLDAAQRLRGKASPFPKDTIIRKSFSLGRGNNMTTSRDLAAFDSSLDTQKKKREYLDMVTNPDRFRTYKAAPTAATTSPATTVSDVSDRYDNGNFFSGPSVSLSRNSPVVESIAIPPPPPPPPPNMPPMPNDLGARLGAHALASEKIAADLRRQAEEDRREKERLLEEERREQERRNQEAQMAREAELLRREREVAERKRAQEEALRKAEEDRKRKEEERIREMMQAQEAYWAQKLQMERSARDKKGGKASKQGEEQPDTPVASTDEATAQPELTAGISSEGEQVNAQPPATAGSPLNDVARARSEVQSSSPWSWPQRTAADILGRNPRKSAAAASTSSLSAFQAEQARQKEEIERTKALQLERLKALNSPIPNRPASHGVTPSTGAFQPQFPTSSTGGSRNLAGLSRVTVQSPPPQPLKDDSLDDVFPPAEAATPKPSNTVGSVKESVSKPAAVAKPVTTTKPLSAWSGLGNNAVKAKKDVEENVVAPKENNANNAAKSKTPVIRQQLPFDDEDGISRDSKGLSIAEVMKRVKTEAGDPSTQQERSKKWGVDMSRFREN